MGLRAARHRRGEEDREVHHPWAVHAEDKGQACQEGWYFYGLWQNNQGEGSSRHEDCQGILCQSSERQHLKSSSASDQFWALLYTRRPRGSTTECFSLAAAQDVGISTPFERRGL